MLIEHDFVKTIMKFDFFVAYVMGGYYNRHEEQIFQHYHFEECVSIHLTRTHAG